MGGFDDVVVKLHQAGGETAHKGVARAGRVHHFDVVGADPEIGLGLGDQAAAGSEGDDDHRDLEAAAQPMQGVNRQGMQRGGGELAQTAEGGGAQQHGTGRTFFHERDELALVGNEHLGVPEQGQIKLGSHGRGVQDRDCAVAPGGPQHEANRGVVGLALADDDLGGGKRGEGNVARPQVEVGAEGNDDLVLARGVDRDDGGPRGMLGFLDDEGGEAGPPRKLPGTGAERIRPHRADKQGANPGARGGDGLIEALAAGTGSEITDHGFTHPGKIFGVERKVLHKTTDDDDGGLHEWDSLKQGRAGVAIYFGGSCIRTSRRVSALNGFCRKPLRL